MRSIRFTYVLIAMSMVCGLSVSFIHGRLPEQAIAAEPRQPVWGLPFHGLIATFQSDKGQYQIGEQIRISGRMKNIGDQEACFALTQPNIDETPALFNEDGSPATLTQLGTDMLSGKLPTAITRRIAVVLQPGQEQKMDTLILNEWYDINAPGNYHLIILRHVNEGVVVSNRMTIPIVK